MPNERGGGSSQTSLKIQQLNRRINDLSDELHPRKDSNIAPKVAKQSYKKKPTPKPLQGPFSIFVACLPGLEPLLLEEVSYLLATSEKSERNKAKAIPGGVQVVVPSIAQLYALHLYLGTASHIYLRLNGGARSVGLPPLFRARGFPELQRKLKELMVSQRWDQWLDVPRSRTNAPRDESSLSWQLQVHVTTSKSKLMHTKAVEERVRETIGEVLGIKGLECTNSVSGVDATANGAHKGVAVRPVVRLLVRIDRDEVQLSLDTSSSSSATPLHMRGYRLNPHKAPLREDLAFALLMAGGLKPRWNLQPLKSLLLNDDPAIVGAPDSGTKIGEAELLVVTLFDPLCGSGTIAIEGASILAGLPPGRFRPPPFEGTKVYNVELWNDIKSKALSLSMSTGTDGDTKAIMVAANDINKEAIQAAISNSKRAEVEQFIDFTVGSFKIHPLSNHSRQKSPYQVSDSRDLLLVTNPPYGKRILPDESTGSSIYKQIANAMKSLPYGIRCTMIGKDPRSLRESSLPLKVAFSTKHGGLSVVAMSTCQIENKPRVERE
jgi:putative N6-adenine-specific DNA methylase